MAKATGTKRLSAAFVRTITEPGWYGDGNGLYLVVGPNGAKRWMQRIVIRGKRCDLGLGSLVAVGLAEARDIAVQNTRSARTGGNPLQEKREADAILTFEEAARKVHEIHKPTWRNVKHAAQFISTLETYAFPRMGKAKAADVDTADVLAVLTPIWVTKPETARRVRQRIGTVMKWAIAQGWRQDNPADTIAHALPKTDRTQQNRKSLPYCDVSGCIAAVKASEAGWSTKLALEFLALTATRSGEVREARWDEIDLAARVWQIPAARMKAKRPHRVPLCDRAVAILCEAEGLSEKPGYVFPGSKEGKPISDATLLKLVRSKGYAIDIHGFRTSFRTWAQEKTNYPREVAEAAMAHKVGDKAEQAYARSDMFEKRRMMMEEWSSYLKGANRVDET